MRNYKMTIAYDGTRYQGWQRQSLTDNTIQGILERAITETVGYPVTIDGSGRTDGGVHAYGQTANVKLSGKMEEAFLRDGVNGHLPEDIRIRKIELVRNGFHSRLSATGKTYRYTVNTRERPDVFHRKYVYHYPEKLDVDQMKRAAGYLVGSHDFTAFTDQKEDKASVRAIKEIRMESCKGKVIFTFHGTGFLYHMVRILTGTLLEVGTGRRTPESVKEALGEKDRSKSGFLAPAMGLCLMHVDYE